MTPIITTVGSWTLLVDCSTALPLAPTYYAKRVSHKSPENTAMPHACDVSRTANNKEVSLKQIPGTFDVLDSSKLFQQLIKSLFEKTITQILTTLRTI